MSKIGRGEKNDTSQQEDKNRQANIMKRYNTLVSRWYNAPSPTKTFLKLLPVLIILAAIPLTVRLLQQTQNLKQEAAVNCTEPLQSLINTTPTGTTLDISSCTFSAGAIINKPMILSGGTINVPAGQKGLTVTANDVTIDGIHIIGSQSKVFNGDEKGINVETTPATAVKNLVIKNSEIGNFGYGSIYLQHVENLTVENNKLYDDVYAGIMVLSGIGGKITGNTVERIGVNGADANSNNAYGIGLSRITTDLTTDPYTTDFTVSNNTITDVPTWHALDTHAGQHLTFSGNTVYRASRALFITTDSVNNRPSDITVTGNLFGSPSPVTFNLVAVTTYDSNNVTITANTLSAAWSNGAGIYDYQNLSTNLVVSNNAVGETLPNAPTLTPTSTSVPTLTSTPTPSPKPTATSTPVPTATPTPIPTATPTPKPTLTPTPTSANKLTPTPTIARTAPTPTTAPTPNLKKHCYKFIYWKFCY